MPAERLQKIIAAAGVASRRKAEELITSGRVLVNGQPVTQLGSKADPEQDHIRVDGKLVHAPERFSYIVLNKPKGYVTTVSDPEHRPTVMDLVRSVKGRVYPVGRLDWASEGLLLLTNDGTLANALMKAASHVAKTYVVKVAGVPDELKLDKLRGGISIAEKGGRRVRTAPAQIKLIREGDNPWLEVIIIEGRNVGLTHVTWHTAMNDNNSLGFSNALPDLVRKVFERVTRLGEDNELATLAGRLVHHRRLVEDFAELAPLGILARFPQLVSKLFEFAEDDQLGF